MLLDVKDVQFFPVLGVYSGIFAIYLQYPSNKSKTRLEDVVFYILCLLYGFCAATVVCDLLVFTFEVSNKFIFRILFSSSVAQLRFVYALSLQLQIDLQPIYNRIGVVQLQETVVNACCDFTAQCIIVRINHSSYISNQFYSSQSSKIYRIGFPHFADEVLINPLAVNRDHITPISQLDSSSKFTSFQSHLFSHY